MFIHTHTRGSAPQRFAKFDSQKQTFCGENRKKQLANSSQTDYNGPRDNRDYQEMTISFLML